MANWETIISLLLSSKNFISSLLHQLHWQKNIFFPSPYLFNCAHSLLIVLNRNECSLPPSWNFFWAYLRSTLCTWSISIISKSFFTAYSLIISVLDAGDDTFRMHTVSEMSLPCASMHVVLLSRILQLHTCSIKKEEH